MEDYLFKFSYSYRYRSYIAKIGLANIDNYTTNIRLDSGAVCSVISITSLLTILGSNSILDSLEDKLVNSNIRAVNFTSASGHIISTYPCVLHNIAVGGYVLESFYFYLCLDIDSNITVIGADFLQSCKEYKNIGGPIYVKEIDYDIYRKSFTKLINNSSICNLDSLIFNEDFKDYAASFRKVYGAED